MQTIKTICAEDGQFCEVLGNPVCLKLTGQDTNGEISLVEYMLLPGQDEICRIHSEEDQTLYVLDGQMELKLKQESLRAGAGTVIFVPRNTPHCFQTADDQPCRLLIAITPAGLENYYRECERLASESQVAWDQIADLSAEYGIRLLPGKSSGMHCSLDEEEKKP